MPLEYWIGIYVAWALLCLWVVKGGGAEVLEGSFLTTILFWWKAHDAPKDMLRDLVWILLFISTVIFISGVISEKVRSYFVIPFF
jgi:hypothetical protein